jgi:anti-sigma-K factor RskA
VPTRTVTPPRVRWWERLQLWQGLSVAGIAASLLLTTLLVGRVGVPEAPGARYLAVLQSPDSQATGYVVEVQARGTLRLIPVAPAAAVPAGRALQFWTKAQGAAGPTSLGLVRPGETVQMPVSRLPAVEAQQLFEITLEPEAGSPLDRPTGPILFVGKTVQI